MVQSFGYVPVAVPGTPVRASSVEYPSLPAGKKIPLQSILIEAHPDNTGKIYVIVGLNAAADVRSTGRGVVAILAAPGDPTTGPFPSYSSGLPATPASLTLNDFWIDAENAEDMVVVSGTLG